MEHNSTVNRYLSDNERYADLINGFEFDGEQVISADDLTDADTQVFTPFPAPAIRKGRKRKKIKYRDLIRKAAFGVNFMVIGIENQEEVHYLMPLRVMSYDAGEYERQASLIRKQVRKIKKIKSGEFLSGFTRESRLHPCVTYVLYYGDNWDGAKELHDILDFTNIPEPLKKLVNNYKIHLIEVKKLQDTSVFHTDLKQVFDFIRYSKDKTKLKTLVQSDSAYSQLDEDAYDMAALYTNTTELMELKAHHQKGDNVDMCQAIKEWLADERAEGVDEGIKLGLNKGIEALILDNIEENIPMERICEKLQRRFGLTAEEAKAAYEEYAK